MSMVHINLEIFPFVDPVVVLQIVLFATSPSITGLVLKRVFSASSPLNLNPQMVLFVIRFTNSGLVTDNTLNTPTLIVTPCSEPKEKLFQRTVLLDVFSN